jgi:hypothetical protein
MVQGDDEFQNPSQDLAEFIMWECDDNTDHNSENWPLTSSVVEGAFTTAEVLNALMQNNEGQIRVICDNLHAFRVSPDGFVPSEGVHVLYSVYPHGHDIPAVCTFNEDEGEWVLQTSGEWAERFEAWGLASYCMIYSADSISRYSPIPEASA